MRAAGPSPRDAIVSLLSAAVGAIITCALTHQQSESPVGGSNVQQGMSRRLLRAALHQAGTPLQRRLQGHHGRHESDGRDKFDLLEETGQTEELPQNWLAARVPILPLDPDGYIRLKPTDRLSIQVGVHTQTQFRKELLHDSNLIVLGFEADYRLVQQQSFVHPRFYLFPLALGRRPRYQAMHMSMNSACNSLRKPNPNITLQHSVGAAKRSAPSIDEKTHQVAMRSWVKREAQAVKGYHACLREVQRRAVGVSSLGSVLARVPPGSRVSSLKVDTQGFDFDVVQSAARYLHLVDYVQMEVYDTEDASNVMYVGAEVFSTVREYLKGHGFVHHAWLTDASTGDYFPQYYQTGEIDVAFCRSLPCYVKYK